jgi:hypothetical protein
VFTYIFHITTSGFLPCQFFSQRKLICTMRIVHGNAAIANATPTINTTSTTTTAAAATSTTATTTATTTAAAAATAATTTAATTATTTIATNTGAGRNFASWQKPYKYIGILKMMINIHMNSWCA